MAYSQINLGSLVVAVAVVVVTVVAGTVFRKYLRC